MQRMEIGQRGVTNVAITSKKKQALPCDQREVSQWSFLLLVGGKNGLITGVELKEGQ